MLKALVEKSGIKKGEFCVISHQSGIDEDWTNVFQSSDEKACKKLAKELNRSFTKQK
jgi:hypothetical protein